MKGFLDRGSIPLSSITCGKEGPAGAGGCLITQQTHTNEVRIEKPEMMWFQAFLYPKNRNVINGRWLHFKGF